LTSAERGRLITAESFPQEGDTTKFLPSFYFHESGSKMDVWHLVIQAGGCKQKLKLTKRRPIPLLLDGHSSHTKNIGAVDTADVDGNLVCFAPHSTKESSLLELHLWGLLATTTVGN
jgi:hypothetical protein